MPRRIEEALEIATSGRPGPVLVELPMDVPAGLFKEAGPSMSTVFPRDLSPAQGQ